jgi:biotin carboxyl carrier protein
MSSKRYLITIKGKQYEVEVGDLSTSPVTVMVDGIEYQVEVPGRGAQGTLPAQPAATPRPAAPPPQASAPAAPPRPAVPAGGDGTVRALMPGRIVRVNVTAGAPVTAGQPVLVMESMKMENTITAPKDGTVRSVMVNEGDSVQYGQTMMEIE